MSNLNDRQFGGYWHQGGGGKWLAVPTTAGSKRGQGQSTDFTDVARELMNPPDSWEHEGMLFLDDSVRADGTDAQRYLERIGGSGIDIPIKDVGRRPPGAVAKNAEPDWAAMDAERYAGEPDEPVAPVKINPLEAF